MNRVFHAALILGLLSPLSGAAALVMSPGPAAGIQVVTDHLSAIQQHDFFKGVGAADLIVGDVHQVYSVALTNIAGGKLLSAATSGAWRYLVMNGTNAVGEAIVSSNDKGDLAFAGI